MQKPDDSLRASAPDPVGTMPRCSTCGYPVYQEGLRTITCVCAPSKASGEGADPDWQARYLELRAAARRFNVAADAYQRGVIEAPAGAFDAIAEEFTESRSELRRLSE